MEPIPSEIKSLVVNDMTFAAYLKMRGCRLLSANKLGESFKFVFEEPENLDQLELDLANSEIVRFDASVRDLKRLVYSKKKSKER